MADPPTVVSRLHGAGLLKPEVRHRPGFPKPGLAARVATDDQFELAPKAERHRTGTLLMARGKSCRKANGNLNNINNMTMALQW